MSEYHPDAMPQHYEPHFCKHMMAMTREALHDKSDIALELAIRDAEIERLQRLLSAAPDPASYKPEEYIEAWLKWKRAQSSVKRGSENG